MTSIYVFCPVCDRRLSARDMSKLNQHHYPSCARCGSTLDTETYRVHLADECKRFESKTETKSATWYHVSSIDPDKLDLSSERFSGDDVNGTHVGTQKTVRDYRRFNLKDRHVRTFQFRLKSRAKIADIIADDHNDWVPYERGISNGEYDILRYINRYEGPGQISLLVNPKALQLIKVGRVH